jgi:hypothetical protein
VVTRYSFDVSAVGCLVWLLIIALAVFVGTAVVGFASEVLGAC